MNIRSPNVRRHAHTRQGGFSFTEILFAVMILGIGFIMVAAMFPVAIHQTEANNQETITAAVARSSSNYLTQLAAMPLPNATIAGYPSVTTATPSILLPTFPNAQLPLANQFTLPPNQSSMVVPGQVWTMYDARDAWQYSFTSGGGTASHYSVLWTSIAKNMIQPDDSRFGWAAMYRRDLIVRGPPNSTGTSIAPATFAQVIVIGARCRSRQFYDPQIDLPNPPTAKPCPLLPTLAGNLFSGATGSTGTGVVLTPPAFAGGTSYLDFKNVGFPAALTEMSYVVICDDNIPIAKASHGTLNGRIFRVGTTPTGGSAWPLLPGSDVVASDQVTLNNMAKDAGQLPQFNVLIVGRGRSGTGGPAQDVTAYTTFLPIAN